MDDETLFAWVHISDIHFGHGDASHGWDQRLVLDRLAQDLPEAMRLGAPKPDAILVTGDIAFSGAGRSPDEYTAAEAWLQRVGAAVGLGADRIFLVPGNHDVNRGLDAKLNVGTIVNALRAGEIPLDEALRDGEIRGILAKRMAGYLALAAKFAPGCLSKPPPPEQPLFWTHRLAGRGGLAVRLCGLNTALLSRDDTDQGKLQLGMQQVNQAILPAAAPGEVVVVLSHHPLREWLSDGKRADEWLRNGAHLHVSGHVHEAESREARDGSGGHFVGVTAGAAHGEMLRDAWVAASHGYNFAAVVRGAGDKLALRVWPRRWAERSKSFRVDTDAVGDGERSALHALRATLPSPSIASLATPETTVITEARGQPAPVGVIAPPAAEDAAPPASPRFRLPATNPVRIFVSCAEADETAKASLFTALASLRREKLVELSSSRRGDAPDAAAVDPKLDDAQIILLLLSRDYLAWDYGYDVEMEAARARQGAGTAQVMAVLLRRLDLTSRTRDYKRIATGQRAVQWIDTLPRLPHAGGRDSNNDLVQPNPDGIPIATWSREDDAWTEVALELRDEIARLRLP